MKKVGILGGGQLGLMLYQRALSYPVEFFFLDPSLEAPVSKASPNFIHGDFTDYDTVISFGEKMDIVSIEIEQVNIKALKVLRDRGIRVVPSPEVLEIIQNKRKQKEFYIHHGIPTSPLADEKKFPFVAKAEEGGYDGKGVIVVNSDKDLSNLFKIPYVAEQKADIAKELSVMVIKQQNKIVCSPVVEQVFCPKYNLVDYLISPARIDSKTQNLSVSIAREVVEKFQGDGIFAVELFLNKDESIWVNEIAPRPHNSGHVGMESWSLSQFDALIRVLLEIDIEVWNYNYFSAMINLIGNDLDLEQDSNIKLYSVLKDDFFLHWYQKSTSKMGRKMGHINLLSSNGSQLENRILQLKNTLKNIKI